MPRNRDRVDLSKHSPAGDAPASFPSPSLLCWAGFAVPLWQGGRYPAVFFFFPLQTQPNLRVNPAVSFLIACYCPEGSSDFFGLNCMALRLESTFAREHVGTLCCCRWQGHACLPGLCLPLHPSQHVGLFCSPLRLFAKHRGPGAWKISRLHTLLLPAGLLPSLPVKSLGGDCSWRGQGSCTGVH